MTVLVTHHRTIIRPKLQILKVKNTINQSRGFGREQIHVYVWLSPFTTHLKLTTLLIGYTLIQNISGVKKYKESKSTIDMFVYSVAKSCLTLCDPIDCSPPGSSVHGIFQARMLERIVISSSGDLSNPTQGFNPCVLNVLHCRWILYC